MKLVLPVTMKLTHAVSIAVTCSFDARWIFAQVGKGLVAFAVAIILVVDACAVFAGTRRKVEAEVVVAFASGFVGVGRIVDEAFLTFAFARFAFGGANSIVVALHLVAQI